MDRIDKLKKLLGITGNDMDFILNFVLEAVTDMVLNYCNIAELPEGLENIVLSMCVDKYRAEGYGSEQAAGNVKSISEGDVSVAFGSPFSGTDNPSMPFLKGYEQTLNRFRKLGRW